MRKQDIIRVVIQIAEEGQGPQDMLFAINPARLKAKDRRELLLSQTRDDGQTFSLQFATSWPCINGHNRVFPPVKKISLYPIITVKKILAERRSFRMRDLSFFGQFGRKIPNDDRLRLAIPPNPYE